MDKPEEASHILKELGTSKKYIEEQAYLIARGVRPLVILGSCPAEPIKMAALFSQLQYAASYEDYQAIPFVLDETKQEILGTASYGYAAAPWVLDLYRYIVTLPLPAPYYQQVLGLLLGYSTHSIRQFGERTLGQFFTPPPPLFDIKDFDPKEYRLVPIGLDGVPHSQKEE